MWPFQRRMSQCPISRLSCILCSVFKVRFLNSFEFRFQYSVSWILKSNLNFSSLEMVGLNGLEPSTSRLSGGRSNLLSYKPIFLSAATFFFAESYPDRKLLLTYCECFLWKLVASRAFLFGFGSSHYPLVEIIGIEPMTPCLQSRCSPSWAIPPGLEVRSNR